MSGWGKPKDPDDYSPITYGTSAAKSAPEDWLDEFYPATQDPTGRDEDLTRRALMTLATKHANEFESIYAELEHQRVVAELMKEIERLAGRIEKQREMNPQGVNVPALSETNGRILEDIKRIANDVKTLEAQLAVERKLNPDGVDVPKVLEALKFQGLDVLVDSTVVKA